MHGQPCTQSTAACVSRSGLTSRSNNAPRLPQPHGPRSKQSLFPLPSSGPTSAKELPQLHLSPPRHHSMPLLSSVHSPLCSGHTGTLSAS